MSLVLGRISYLPNDLELRQVRIKESTRAFSVLEDIVPKDCKKYIVAQNYTEDEIAMYLSDQQVLVRPPIKCAGARNVLLKMLYESNDDYMLILDDDISMYNYYGVSEMLLDWHLHSEKFIKNNIFFVNMIEPQYIPFKKVNSRIDMRNRYAFVQSPMSNSKGNGIYVNFKKYCGFELYYDETLVTGEREDIKFAVEAIRRGVVLLESRNMIQKTYCSATGKSTIYSGKDIYKEANDAVKKMALSLGIPVKNNKVQFHKALPLMKGWIYVQRDKPWEGDMPKIKPYNKKPKANLLNKVVSASK